MPLPALEALERLHEGNRRFAAGLRSLDMLVRQTPRPDLLAGPIASLGAR